MRQGLKIYSAGAQSFSKMGSDDYEASLKHLCAIASPLASKKLTKKLFKLVKKASKEKQLKRGVKEVVKSIRKGQRGLLVLAGDISPVDVISHLPVIAEEAGIKYVYVPSRSELGSAGATKRPTSCVLIAENKEYADEWKEVIQDMP